MILTPGGLGEMEAVLFEGAVLGEVLLLLDGRPLRPLGSGLLDLNLIPLELVERIEVYEGNLSTIYGPGASAGVVNVVTRADLPEDAESLLSGAVGQFDDQIYRARLQRALGTAVGLEVAGSRRTTDGLTGTADLLGRHLGASVEGRWGTDWVVRLLGMDSEIEGALRTDFSARPSAVETGTSYLQASVGGGLGTWALQGDVWYGTTDRRDPGDPVASVGEGWQAGQRVLLVERQRRLLFGWEVEGVGQELKGSADLLLNDRGRAAILGGWAPSLGVWRLRLGGRWEILEGQGGTAAWTAGLAWQASPHVSVFGTAGAGWGEMGTGLGDRAAPRSWEVRGGVTMVKGSVTTRLLLWHREVEDVALFSPLAGGLALQPLRTVGRGESQGGTVRLEAQSGIGLTGGAELSVQQTERNGGERLPLQPSTRAAFRLRYRKAFFASRSLEATIDLTGRYEGDRVGLLPEGSGLSSFFILEWGVRVRLLGFTAFLRVWNPLDQSAVVLDELPLPGRTVRGGVAWRFGG